MKKRENMKIYITADIEGITGAAHWDETDKKNADYGEFREQMTAEVAAACEGALNAGAAEVWVKDAHWTAGTSWHPDCPARSGSSGNGAGIRLG